MMSMNFNDVAISKVKNGKNRCIIIGISKRKAMQLMRNIDFTEKIKHY